MASHNATVSSHNTALYHGIELAGYLMHVLSITWLHITQQRLHITLTHKYYGASIISRVE